MVSKQPCWAVVAAYNADPDVHGILVQLPMPKHIDEERVLGAIDYEKVGLPLPGVRLVTWIIRIRLSSIEQCSDCKITRKVPTNPTRRTWTASTR